MGDGIEEREGARVESAAREFSPGPSAEANSMGAFQPILDALPQPMLLARADRILALNRAFAALLESDDAEQLAGRSLSGALEARVPAQEARQALLLWLVEAKGVAEVISEPIAFASPARERALVRLTRTRAMLGNDEIAVITASPVEVPATRIRAESTDLSAVERLTSVAELAGSAAQAVNNPLAYIATNVAYSSERLEYISDLLDESSPMQVKDPRMLRGLLLPVIEALGEAHVGAGRASQLIKDLRSLIDQDTALIPIDLHPALVAAVNMAEGEVSLHAHLRTKLEARGFVLANTTRLTQLFLGLIVCRAQALESGSPQKFRIDVHSWTEGPWALISVGDNARGAIAASDAPQAESEVPPLYAEAQAAIDLCGRLVTWLGGTLEFQRAAPRGSMVTLRLPLTDSSRKQPQASLSPAIPGRRTRVLVIDNEPLIVRALSRLLRADYDVETAGGGYEALELIRHDGPFDLLLCDLAMPEMGGLELFDEATRLAPEMGPRFVFVTGGAINEQVQAKLNALPNRVLEKPIQPQVLREAVAQLLGTVDERPTPH